MAKRAQGLQEQSWLLLSQFCPEKQGYCVCALSMHIVKKHHTAVMYGLLICNYLLTHLSPSLPLSRAETVSWVQQCVSRCTTGLRQVYWAQYWDLSWTRAHGKEVVASNEKAESGPNAPECSTSVKRGTLHLTGHDSFTTLKLEKVCSSD